MSEELDPNKIAAEVLLKDTTRSVTGGVRDVLKKFLDIFRKDLNTYLENTIRKCSYIKTPIINRDTPTFIFDIYVHTRISLRSKTYVDDDFISELPNLKSLVIAGNAGSGKTMLMRYIFIALCESNSGEYHYLSSLET